MRNIFAIALHDMIISVNVCVGKDIIYWTIIMKNVSDSFIYTDFYIHDNQKSPSYNQLNNKFNFNKCAKYVHYK